MALGSRWLDLKKNPQYFLLFFSADSLPGGGALCGTPLAHVSAGKDPMVDSKRGHRLLNLICAPRPNSLQHLPSPNRGRCR